MRPQRQAGFTIIEAVVGVAVFGIIATAFYFSINIVVDVSEISRRNTVATNLANEQMELLRNLPYAGLGTVDGNPPGTIPSEQTQTVDNIPYTVDTYISYVDDPYDGEFPDDLYSADYKRARIEVCWEGLSCPRSAILISDFSSNTIETGAGTGVMQIWVRDANTAPVTNATVTVTRANPAVNIVGYTNSDGELIEPMLDPSTNDYHVTATKVGHSTDYTVPVSPEIPDPENRDVSVLEESLTEVTLYIDLTSTLNINTLHAADLTPATGVPLQITGLRQVLGQDTEGEDIPKYDQEHPTDGEGHLSLTGLEWDVYHIVLTGPALTLYSIAGFDHSAPNPDPVTALTIDPDTTTDLNIYLDAYTPYNILFTVRSESSEIITDADIHLVKNGGGYDENRVTTNFGQAFFRDLTPGTYTYTVTKGGFTTLTDTIEVIGQEQPEVTLSSP